MKIKPLTLVFVTLLAITSSCKKNNSESPGIKTIEITLVGDTYAFGKGEVLTKTTSSSSTNLRGFYWSTQHLPNAEANDSNIGINGDSVGIFTCQMEGLTPQTTYYARAYVDRDGVTSYGEEVSFTTLTAASPVVSTNSAVTTTLTSATCQGQITDNKGSSIIEKGICWSKRPSPSIADFKIQDGSGTSDITGQLTNLQQNSIYYYRAYATSQNGTGYGPVNLFCTDVKDIDQNVYKTIRIWGYFWLQQNLAVSHYQNGDPIQEVKQDADWKALTKGGYCNYNNDVTNAQTYGKLYNWYAVSDSRNISPIGWRIPTSMELKSLPNLFTDGISSIKESGTVHWPVSNTATNSSGFTALPGGRRLDVFGAILETGYWWTSETTTPAYFYIDKTDANGIKNIDNNETSKTSGFSVRCIRER